MNILQSLSILLLLPCTLADVDFIVPTTGTNFKAGDVVAAYWRESGRSPRISELLQYDLYLYAGGDTADTQHEVAVLIKDGLFARGNSVSIQIDPGVGGNEANAYFLKMVASGPETFAINFSNRFTLSNMTGSFPPHLVDEIRSLSDHCTLSFAERSNKVCSNGQGTREHYPCEGSIAAVLSKSLYDRNDLAAPSDGASYTFSEITVLFLNRHFP